MLFLVAGSLPLDASSSTHDDQVQFSRLADSDKGLCAMLSRVI